MVIAVIAVLPPILHFLTGPIAPAIGGYIAGSKLKLGDNEIMIMGVILAIVAGVPAYLLLKDFTILSGSVSIIAAIVAALWTGGLAAFAALFASSSGEQGGDTAATAD